MQKLILILQPPTEELDDLIKSFNSHPSQFAVSAVKSKSALFSSLKSDDSVDLVVIDTVLGDGKESGLPLIRQLRDLNSDLPILAVADHGGVKEAAEAIEAGASDFLVRAHDLNKRVSTLIRKTQAIFELLQSKRQLYSHLSYLCERVQADYQIVGQSEVIRSLINQIERLADIPRPILILGERGTGKELVAHAIHTAGIGPQKTFCSCQLRRFYRFSSRK